MSHPESETSSVVVTCITGLYTTRSRTLFNTEASYSFISHSFVRDHGNFPSPLSSAFQISTLEIDLEADKCIMSCPVVLGDRAFLENLVLFPIKMFDVVLWMDWLTRHHTSNDCKRTVTFVVSSKEEFIYQTCKSSFFAMTISSVKAKRLVNGRCVAYLTSVDVIPQTAPTWRRYR